MKTYQNYKDTGMYGENPRSLGREEYLGRNKRRSGLGDENYSKAPFGNEEPVSHPVAGDHQAAEQQYIQEVYTPGNARTNQDYFKIDFKMAPPMYGEDYSDELYGSRKYD